MLPVKAAAADVDGLAAVCARAFADDPMVRWRRPQSTYEASCAHYRSALTEYVDAGVLWRIQGSAAAAWVSPHDADRLQRVRARNRAAAGSGAPDAAAALRWRWLDSHLPAEPIWFLELIAVAPESQRAGLGGSLLAEGLTRAGAAGMGMFLETSRQQNVPFYESHGFRVVAEGNAPPDGPRVWFLKNDGK
jgi:GNAT superfamily N-acetyltransferase